MSDNIKLIIEIPKEDYKKLVNPYQHNEIWCERLKRMVIHGIPLDDVKEPKNGERFSCPNCGFKADWFIPSKENNTKESK